MSRHARESARLRAVLAIALLAAFAACTPAGDPDDPTRGAPAGVIPWTCVEGGARVLLAFDPEPERRGWGHFGGGAQGSETLAETAARELYEETNCVVSVAPADLAAHAPSRSGSFYSYSARIPYVSAAELARERPACADVERSRWVWVREVDLVAALRAEGGPGEIATAEGEPARVHLWSGALASLRQALADGMLAGSDPCAAIE